jgi:cytochrome c oxidase subunit 2
MLAHDVPGDLRKRLFDSRFESAFTAAMKRLGLFLYAVLTVFPAAGGAAPLNYLSAGGEKARAVLPLTWGVLIVSVSVIAIIAFLVVAGVWRRGAAASIGALREMPVGGPPGLSWIYIGVGLSGIALLATVIWTMWVLAKTYFPHQPAPLDITVTAHQWWWEARYAGAAPSETFVTANEIHIPTGTPVRFELKSADVIHSFWVPRLTGKTDLVPGQTNTTWLDASAPGIYRGQCGEYCGLQHAHMAFVVIAEAPQDFEAWRKHQIEPASPVLDASLFTVNCGSCHAVRGTDAGGVLGPDLSHLMSRRTIAAGTLINTPGNLSAWIADPQRIKPGNRMPRLDLTAPELKQIRTFLYGLK